MYKLGFKGRRAGWQYWSGRAWTTNIDRAAVLTEAEVAAFFLRHSNLNQSRIEKIAV
jgi:hypothetical protein